MSLATFERTVQIVDIINEARTKQRFFVITPYVKFITVSFKPFLITVTFLIISKFWVKICTLERFPFVWRNREELSGKRNRKIFLGQNGTRRACSFYTDLR